MIILKAAMAGIFLLLVLHLQGCARKGPLYIQQAPAVPSAKAQPEQNQPAPNQSVQVKP